jgi:hypothetical protein
VTRAAARFQVPAHLLAQAQAQAQAQTVAALSQAQAQAQAHKILQRHPHPAVFIKSSHLQLGLI